MYFERLKRLAARLMRLDGPWFNPPLDPYAGVHEPRRRGPSGRQSAAAMTEPPPDSSVDATARSRVQR